MTTGSAIFSMQMTLLIKCEVKSCDLLEAVTINGDS